MRFVFHGPSIALYLCLSLAGVWSHALAQTGIQPASVTLNTESSVITTQPSAAEKPNTSANPNIQNLLALERERTELRLKLEGLEKDLEQGDSYNDSRIGDLELYLAVAAIVMGGVGALLTIIIVFFSFRYETQVRAIAQQTMDKFEEEVKQRVELLTVDMRKKYDSQISGMRKGYDELMVKSDIQSQMIQARSYEGTDQSDQAVSIYDQIFTKYADDKRPRIQRQVANAVFNKALYFYKSEKLKEELNEYSKLVDHFQNNDDPALQETVVMAMVNRGVTLGQLDRLDEELQAYEAVIDRFGTSDAPALQEHVAKAMVNRGVALRQLDRLDEELQAYQALIERFGTSDNPALQEQVANAMVNLGVTLGQLGRNGEELQAYQALIERFGTSDDPALLVLVAKAMVNLGVTLGQLERLDEALEALQAVIDRFGSSDDPALLVLVAKAMVNRGATLWKLDRLDEELQAYQAVIDRFGTSDNPALQENVIGARNNMADIFLKLEQYESGHKVLDDMFQELERLPTDFEHKTVSLGYVTRIELFEAQKDLSGAEAALAAMEAAFQEEEEEAIQNRIKMAKEIVARMQNGGDGDNEDDNPPAEE